MVALVAALSLSGCTCASSHLPADDAAVVAPDAVAPDAPAPAVLGACDDPATWTAPATSGGGARLAPDTHCAPGRFDVLVRYVLRVEASRACLRVTESSGSAPAPGTTFEIAPEGLALRLAAGDSMTFELRYVDASSGLLVRGGRTLDVTPGATSVLAPAPFTGLDEALLAGGTRLWSRGAEADVGPHEAAARVGSAHLVVVKREAADLRLVMWHDSWSGSERVIEQERELVVADPGGALRFVPRCQALTVGGELWMLSLESDDEPDFAPVITQRVPLSSAVRDVAALGPQVGLVLLEDRRLLACVAGREPFEVAALPFAPERLLGGAAIADDARVARVRLEGAPYDSPEVLVDAPFPLPDGIGTPRALASDDTVIGSLGAANELPAAHGEVWAPVPRELGVEILASDLEWVAIRTADDRIGLWARRPNSPGCEL